MNRSVPSCVSGRIPGHSSRVENGAGIRQSVEDAGRQLGKTFYMAVRGGEVTTSAARAVGNHSLPISPSRSLVRPIYFM